MKPMPRMAAAEILRLAASPSTPSIRLIELMIYTISRAVKGIPI